MKTSALKASLHQLIDRTDNGPMLTIVHDLLKGAENKNGSLWQSLSEGQKQEVICSYEESEDEANLIPVEHVLKPKS